MNLSGMLYTREKYNERAPDYNGWIAINGERYQVVGWTRLGDNDIPKIRIQLRRGGEKTGWTASPPPAETELDDELPF